MSRTFSFTLLGLAVVGCTSGQVPGSSAHGNLKLGVVDFQTTETASELSIVGLDATGQEVARIDVQRGKFTISPDWNEGVAADVVGRKFKLDVQGKTGEYQGVGVDNKLNMPPAPEPQATFLHDSYVEPLLSRWGINFQQSSAPVGPGGEEAYDLGAYSGSTWGFVLGTASSYTSPTLVSGTWRIAGPGTGSTGTPVCNGNSFIDARGMTSNTAFQSYSNETIVVQICSTGLIAIKTCNGTTGSDCGAYNGNNCQVCTSWNTSFTAPYEGLYATDEYGYGSLNWAGDSSALQAGDACEGNSSCYSGSCSGSTCACIGNGGSCRRYEDCCTGPDTGLGCVNGTCTQVCVPDGTACDESTNCCESCLQSCDDNGCWYTTCE